MLVKEGASMPPFAETIAAMLIHGVGTDTKLDLINVGKLLATLDHGERLLSGRP